MGRTKINIVTVLIGWDSKNKIGRGAANCTFNVWVSTALAAVCIPSNYDLLKLR